MIVQLRPHHLLCMLTYVGKGYSPEFVANYDAIAERLGRGGTILIVDGPDDICAPLLHAETAHCRRPSVRAATPSRPATLPSFSAGRSSQGWIDLTAELIECLRGAFASRRIRAACSGCEWSELCSGVAGNGFGDVRVFGRGEAGGPSRRLRER